MGMTGTGKIYCLISKMISMFLELFEREQTSPGTEYYKIKDIIIVFHMSEKTLRFIKDKLARILRILIPKNYF